MATRQKVFKGRSLNGRELAGFIKERQAKQVRSFVGTHKRVPKLAIIKTVDDPAINTYVRLKQRYGEDIGVLVETHALDQSKVADTLEQLNQDDMVDAIIIQLPLQDPDQTSTLLNMVNPTKDVDGLHDATQFDSATATAILWLLAGYNVNLAGQHIVVVGQGRLVGKPVADYLEGAGHQVTRCDQNTQDLQAHIESANILISATGVAGLIKSDWIQPGAVVVDAGVAGEQGKLIGDVEAQALNRTDISITPEKGGLGPLTVCALFENVLKAANNQQ